MLHTPTILAWCLLHVCRQHSGSKSVCLNQLVRWHPFSRKPNTWHGLLKSSLLLSTNAIFNTCIKENLQFITGLLKSGAFSHGFTARTKNTCTCNAREIGHKVHIVSNHTWSKHRLNTGCSPKSRYKGPGMKFRTVASYVQAHENQIGYSNYSTGLISRFGTERKVTVYASFST